MTIPKNARITVRLPPPLIYRLRAALHNHPRVNTMSALVAQMILEWLDENEAETSNEGDRHATSQNRPIGKLCGTRG